MTNRPDWHTLKNLHRAVCNHHICIGVKWLVVLSTHHGSLAVTAFITSKTSSSPQIDLDLYLTRVIKTWWNTELTNLQDKFLFRNTLIKYRLMLTLISPWSFSLLMFFQTHSFQFLKAITPGFPGVPLNPLSPRSPFCPWGPWAPRSPLAPSFPLAPGFPLGPGGPWGPEFPGIPWSPLAPSRPSRPSRPGIPGEPGLPCMPGIPA